jgi:hypothetical protein
MLNESQIQLLERVEKSWHERRGLAAAIILAAVLAVGFSAGIGLSAAVSVGVLFVVVVAVGITWWFDRQPKKTEKDKIGFAVSVHCDPELETEIHEDFVISLQRLVLSGKLSSLFHFIEIPPHISANTLDIQSARKLREKTRSHFLLFGRVRKREIANATRYFLEFDAIVAHKAIAPEIQERFSAEFGSLLPRKVEVDEAVSFAAFDFTTRVTEAVSKYVIGIAMTLSGFYDDAEPMLREASKSASSITPSFPTCEKIVEQTGREISAINLIKADRCYARWRDAGFDTSEIANLEAALENVDHVSLQVLSLRAIHAFLAERDTHKARKLLYQIPKPSRDGVWEYNQGFLFAYDGNLQKARKYFLRGAHMRIPHSKSIAELELFMCWVIDQEPKCCQLHLALGLLNWHLKGDLESAVRDFENFAAGAQKGSFDREQALAKLWVQELNRRIIKNQKKH